MIRDLSNLHSPKSEDAQNFVAQVPTEEIVRTSGFYLSLALDVLTIALALWVGLLYQELLVGGGSLWNIALVATGFGACLSLGLYLTKHAMRRAIVIASAIVGLFVFTLSPLTVSFAGIAVPVSLLLILWGEALGRARIANSLHIRFIHGAQPLLAKTMMALIASGLILFIPYWTPARAFFSQSVFESTFKIATAVVHRFYREITFTGTLDDLEASLARYQLSTRPFSVIDYPTTEEVVRATTEAIKADFSKALRIDPSEGKQPLSKVLYEVALRTFGDFEKQFGSWFLGIWLLIMFFALRAVGIVLSWIAGAVAYLFFQLFLVAKIIRFRGETETQEIVEYV